MFFYDKQDVYCNFRVASRGCLLLQISITFRFREIMDLTNSMFGLIEKLLFFGL